MVDFTTSLYGNEVILISSPPEIVLPFDNIFKPFNLLGWSIIAVFILLFIIVIIIFYFVVKNIDHLATSNKKNPDVFDFIMSATAPFFGGSFSSWFHVWSSGGLLIFTLQIFVLFTVFFYNSNLLVHLVRRDTVRPVDGIDDIVESGHPLMSNPGIYWDNLQEDYPKVAEYAIQTSGKVLALWVMPD